MPPGDVQPAPAGKAVAFAGASSTPGGESPAVSDALLLQHGVGGVDLGSGNARNGVNAVPDPQDQSGHGADYERDQQGVLNQVLGFVFEETVDKKRYHLSNSTKV